MNINPTLEKHFNRFVLRAFGASLLALCGVLFVGGVFWSLRHTIPLSLSIGLAAIGIVAWLFGAKHAFDQVIPDIHQVFAQASEEELRRVLSQHPPGTDMHDLALSALKNRQPDAPSA